MTDKLTRIAHESQGAIIEQAEERAGVKQGWEWTAQSLKRAGAAEALDVLAGKLQSAVMRQWIAFAEDGGYKAEGCTSMAEYLDKFRPNKMDHNEYHRRKNLLEKEGDDAFDLLNGIGVSREARKYIGAGDITIIGDVIKVGDQAVSASDPKAVKRLFNEAADAFGRAEEKAEKERRHYQKLMKRQGFTFTIDENGKETITPPDSQQTIVVFDKHSDADPANHAYLKCCASLAELQRELKQLPSDEAEKRLAQYRLGIQSALESVLFFAAADSPTRRPDNVLDSGSLADLLTDQDLAELAED